jgi:hypothetical protein
MRKSLFLIAAAALALNTGVAQDKIKVLIIDGQNNHNWKAMTPVMKSELEKTGMVSVDVSTSPSRPPRPPRPKKGLPPPDNSEEQKKERATLTAKLMKQFEEWNPKFEGYQVVISNYNGQLWGEQTRKDFEAYIKGGGTALIIHAANNAFPQWKEYNKMIGLGWRNNKFGIGYYYDDAGKLIVREIGKERGTGHGSQHEFPITIRGKDHPITKGMPEVWLHAQDELYHGQRGPGENMQILASAFSSKEKRGTGVHEPMIWIVPYGKGKVITNVMGHENKKSLQCIGFITLMNRSVEWLATGKVTTGIPEKFPTRDRSSSINSK